MGTVAVTNPEQNEKRSPGERLLLHLLRAVLPPHADNEDAAAFFQTEIRNVHPHIDWVIVRPDSLINDAEGSPYDVVPALVHSISKPGKTSRINVGRFMAALLTDDALFAQWKGQMPVIYNRESLA
jgi:hypothetical protein